MTLYQGWNPSFHSSCYILLRGAGASEGSADWSFAKPLETHSASLCLKVPGPPWGWWLLPSLSRPTLVHRIPAGCSHLQAAAEAVVGAQAGLRDHTWVVWRAEAKELMETSRKGSYFLMVMSILDRSEAWTHSRPYEWLKWANSSSVSAEGTEAAGMVEAWRLRVDFSTKQHLNIHS